jgi:hypothetical protein
MAAPHVAALIALGGYATEPSTFGEPIAIMPGGNVGCSDLPPNVTLADPGADLRGTVTLTAAAGDPDGSVTQVAFQRKLTSGETWSDIALDATAPYQATFDTTTVADGTYDLRAVATDNGGATGSSTVADRRVDNTAPTVSSVTPANGTIAVAVGANVTATFSEAMDTATLTAATFTLSGPSGNVAATVAYDAATNSATLDPVADLVEETTYAATVTGGAGGATDEVGNPLEADEVWSFTTAPPPDTTPPETTVTSGPAEGSLVNESVASFTYDATEAGSAFECALDGAAFAACPATGQTYSGLTDGSHTFAVRAADAAGNADQTPASRAWTIDTAAPETTITSAPTNPANSGAATVVFSSSEAGSTFECSLDGGSYQGCTSPKTYGGLGGGGHTFAVRAIDAATNADPTPATYAWAVDVTAPETTITSGPANPSSSANATFGYSATEAATFECSLDGAAFAPCGGPGTAWQITYTGLTNGTHTFAVRAIDAVRNTDPTPAGYTWTVATVTVPAAPSKLKATVQPGAAIKLTWTDSATNETGYRVYRSADNGKTWTAVDLPAGSQEYRDGNVVAGRTYVYRVVAVNGAGESAPAQVTATAK